MFIFTNLKLRFKFILCFSVIIILLLCLGISSVYQMSDMAGYIRQAETETLPAIDTIRKLDSLAQKQQTEAYATVADAAARAEHVKNFTAGSNLLKGKAAELKKAFQNDSGITSLLDAITALNEKNIELFSDLQKDIQDNKLDDVLQKFNRQLNANSDQISEITTKLISDLTKTHEFASNYIEVIIMIVVAIVLSLIMSWMLTRRIAIPIQKLGLAVNEVANGNLNAKLRAVKSHDEIGDLSRSFIHMVEVLKDIVDSMIAHSNDIKESSHQLKTGNETISDSMNEILNQTITVSAASEQLTASSKDIASNCTAAAEAAAQTHSTSLESMNTVHDAVSGIRRHQNKTAEDAKIIDKLGEQTNHIGSIIATIQDIASQTNLLALNAAIEAARAGEHGRGFAVVSDEVRALANRTAESAQEISQMIQAIQDEVNLAKSSFSDTAEQMTEVASRTAGIEDALNSIIEQVNGVSEQINQIASATLQQTATADEMSRNIQQISDMSRVITENSQTAVSTAENMEELSEVISSDVDYFHQ